MFAQDAWNTATYSSGADGYTVTYDDKSYTVALSNQPGYYYWGFNENTENSEWDGNNGGVVPTYDGGILKGNTNGLNDAWGDETDTDSARRGPCDEGYHVPSHEEWQEIMTAWCHLGTNTCTESNISAGYIDNVTLASAFKTSFNMPDGYYWSSSPYPGYGGGRAWNLGVYNSYVLPDRYNDRNNSNYFVRCAKNSTSTSGSFSSSALTWAEVESGSDNHSLVDRLLSFIMPNHGVYLYALAEANTYHVAYSGNQATSGTMENSTFTYDTAGTLRTNAFERAGYTFSGWNTQADNSGTGYADGASVLNWSATDGDTIEIFAQWIARNDTPYVVYHFIKDLSTNTYTLSSTDNLSGTTDTDVEFNSKLKSFTGFTYSGGYLTGSEARPEGAGLTSGSIDKDGNLKIYLYYDRVYRDVYLGGNAGIDTVTGSGRYEYGAEISANTTPKTGYHFVRWEKKNSKSELGLPD